MTSDISKENPIGKMSFLERGLFLSYYKFENSLPRLKCFCHNFT